MSLVDQMAPDFDLEGSDGKRHTLSLYAGNKLLVFFYPKDNTSGCTREATGFRDLKADLDKLGVTVVGVSRDTVAAHKRFIDLHDLNMVLLSDPDGAVMKKYGAFGEKMMYGRAVEGVIRSTVLISKTGKVKKHWTKVPKADQHPLRVLEYLKEFHSEE